MSNRESDSRYETPEQAITFFGQQLLKQVHTSLPGVVVEYDPATRRARVQPAVDLMKTDGTSMPKPILLDVPVLFLTGGGFTLSVPLVAGDPVKLLFAERDIAAFKETLEVGPPLTNDIMEIQHAVAIAGFWPLDGVLPIGAPNPPPGLVLQSNDGMAWVHLQEGMLDATVDGGVTTIHVEAGVIRATPDMGTTTVEVTPGNATVIAAAVNITGEVSVTGNIAVTGDVDGVDVGSHTHRAGTPPGNTGGPN